MMNRHALLRTVIALLFAALSVTSFAEPDSTARSAAERGLAFLEKDAAAWRKQAQCASCHQGTMTLWALSEARRQGYAVPDELLAETAQWTREKALERIDAPRDTRPGWNMVNTSALYLAALARTVPGQNAVSEGDLGRIAGHLTRHQEADGNWTWSQAPAHNRPPPVFESDEVATRLAVLALGQHAPESAKLWLKKMPATDTTQAAALRLLDGKPSRRAIDAFLRRQNPDGGWGQAPGLASDAYATGQALYLLGQAGVRSDRKEVRRAVAFLVANQREDGSWPMASRAHPGEKPMTNPLPIVHFGSAWATLGLMRSH